MPPKIALIHDHLVQDGGAEQVLKALNEIYPQAPIFTLVLDRKNTNKHFADKDIRTSFLQRFPLGVSRYQWWLSLMPAATEHQNLMDYDLVISSASSFAKGVITKPGALHICYCHTPTRYLWNDSHNYLKELKVHKLVKKTLPLILNKLRTWDCLAANRVDHFIANSQTVAERIKKYYGRDSTVIHPPVDLDKFSISSQPKKYYLAGGRLVPYKKIDLVVKAFSRLEIPLKVFGVGPELKRLKKMAKKNVEFLERVSDQRRAELYRDCIAYINPQEEDFGITAVEAMASGRPVIAYRKGGATETIIDGVTGEFFDEQIWEELADRVVRFKDIYNPLAIRAHAEQFSVDNFKRKIQDYISQSIQS